MKNICLQVKSIKGLTLVEVIVAGAILSFLLLGFVSFQYISSRSYQRGIEDVLMQQNQSRLNVLIRQVVQQGNHVAVNPGGLGFKVYTSGNDTAGNFLFTDKRNFAYSCTTFSADICGKIVGESLSVDIADSIFRIVPNSGNRGLMYSILLKSHTQGFGDVDSRINGQVQCRN